MPKWCTRHIRPTVLLNRRTCVCAFERKRHRLQHSNNGSLRYYKEIRLFSLWCDWQGQCGMCEFFSPPLFLLFSSFLVGFISTFSFFRLSFVCFLLARDTISRLCVIINCALTGRNRLHQNATKSQMEFSFGHLQTFEFEIIVFKPTLKWEMYS